MNQPVVEVVLLKLKSGIDDETFLRAADATMKDGRVLSGYMHRQLLKDAHGQWMDVVYWRSLADALAAADAFPTLPSAQPFAELMDSSTLTMLHMNQVRQYDR